MGKTNNPMLITKNVLLTTKLIPFKGEDRLDELRGRVQYYGDIIPPIDEDWSAAK